MLHKIPLFFLFFFLFSSSLLAQDNEKFANMACRFIGCNRSVLHCELQQKQILVIRTSDGKELKLLCVWFPQTRGDAYELDYRFGYTALSFKRKKIDKLPLPDSF